MAISQEVHPPSMLSDHALCHAGTASRRPTPIGGCTSSEAAFPCPCLLPLFCFYSSEPRSPATLWWCPSSPVLAHFRALCVLSGPMQEVPKRYYYVIQEKNNPSDPPPPNPTPLPDPTQKKGLEKHPSQKQRGFKMALQKPRKWRLSKKWRLVKKWIPKNQENGDSAKTNPPSCAHQFLRKSAWV